MGRFQEAEAATRKVPELTGSHSGGHGHLGILQIRAGGDPAEGLAEINRETDDEYREYALAYSYAFLGRKADADSALVGDRRRSRTLSSRDWIGRLFPDVRDLRYPTADMGPFVTTRTFLSLGEPGKMSMIDIKCPRCLTQSCAAQPHR
jgi:hypothetical protein